MTPLRRITATALASLAMALPLAAPAADTPDRAAIRQQASKTFDTPQAKVEMDPIVVTGDRAIAAWTQGARGGRALLARDAHGKWQVLACAGDGLKDPRALEAAGVPAATARELTSRLAKAEAAVPPQRRALFSTFEGWMQTQAGGGHPGRGSAHKH